MVSNLTYSAPGRIEIIGNHTDHQRGCVLAAAINKDISCNAEKHDKIELSSGDFGNIMFDPNDGGQASPGTSEALVRGVVAYFNENGYKAGGFRGGLSGDLRMGAGLSSSAAFSNLIGVMLNHMYNGGIIPQLEIAKASQYAENKFFGKPCGLMDQAASAVGGFVYIDFLPDEPVVKKINFIPEDHGLTVCVVHTGGSHADMTDDYSAIPAEMRLVANYFGKNNLAEINFNDFTANIKELREICGDRAILRSHHFFGENERVRKMAKTLLTTDDTDLHEFLHIINESGNSSISYLQNISNTKTPQSQPIALALALTKQILRGEGACRVHGGGFAGTILAFVPTDIYEEYEKTMNDVFGGNACEMIKIRSLGADIIKS
ncbi:MAG: galactokinase [Defluviitaleaceae bacterium]|nr:galactokinase [Defluviitaleaceae bacterium]